MQPGLLGGRISGRGDRIHLLLQVRGILVALDNKRRGASDRWPGSQVGAPLWRARHRANVTTQSRRLLRKRGEKLHPPKARPTVWPTVVEGSHDRMESLFHLARESGEWSRC
jgi:hypothetical protein